MQMLETYYLLWLIVSSVVAFSLYGFDKNQAKRGKDRVPERTLHLCALVGGFMGGWLGRIIFRHKTQKPMFAVVLIIATLAHCAALFVIRRSFGG
jgi:uncharacterized membrane protein YsdA (DUF1294 family)